MEESDEQNNKISLANFSVLLNLLLKDFAPRNLASNLRKIAEHIEQTPLQGGLIPPDDLEKIIEFKGKQEVFSTEENTEESKDYEQISLLTHKSNYSHGICTKRLRCSQIFDTHEDYDIDLEDFVVKTVVRNSRKSGIEYYEELEEEISFCEKFKEDLVFYHGACTDRLRGGFCLQSSWFQTILILFGCILVVSCGIFMYFFCFK